MKNINQSSIDCMFHKFIKYIKTLYTDEQVIVLYMTISQLNNSLCFNKANHGKIKIRTFEWNVLYILLKKVYFTEGQTTLTAPNSNLKHCWVNVWLSSTGLFEEPHLAGLAGLRPRALPPQRTTVPSGGMLNQHVDFSLTCIWPHGLYWRYCLTSPFFSRNCAGIKGLCFFFLQSVTLWPPCWALLLTDLWRCWGFPIQLGWPVKHCPHSLTQTVRQCHFLHVSGHTLGCCGTCPWSSYRVTDWSTHETARGQHFPRKRVHIRDERANRDFCLFVCSVLLFYLFGLKVFEVFKDDVKKFYKINKRTKSNRTYLSCK